MGDTLDDMTAFNESLAQVMQLARDAATPRAAYERAWIEFWRDHFGAFLQHARGVAARKLPSELVDVFESDLLAEVLGKIARADQQLNRQILAGMRENIIRRLHARIAAERDDDRLEHKLRELLGHGQLDEARHTQLTAELDAIISQVDGPRSTNKSRVMRAILDGPDDPAAGADAVFKQNGAINLAGVARYLDLPEGTVRRTLNELRAEIPSRYPHLAEYLDLRDHHDERDYAVARTHANGDAS